jgi:hypothetical protein
VLAFDEGLLASLHMVEGRRTKGIDGVFSHGRRVEKQANQTLIG